ncbi:MAG: MBL fold metallo-hydrolase [Acidobacteriia bacterium]|nr:MBL fold metallo-hydrolase [Terriglobia bacterium]
MNSRRGFLKRALGACWIGASVLDQAMFRAVRARAQAAGNYTLPTLFDIEKAADGIYMALARPASLINCNAVIIENAADLMIIDTHSKPSAVVSLLRQLRNQVSQKPVRYVVASHFHWDHSHGLPAYRRIAPHADLVASETTRKLIGEQTLPRLKASFDELAKTIEDYKQRLAKATTPQDKALCREMISETQDYLQEMKNFTPELPNLTLERDLIIHDKAHDLHLAFRGRGHTAGDVVVWCPQKKTIATGDLLHGFFPFIGDGYPLDWPRTLVAVGHQFSFNNIAGGHGSLQRDTSRLYQMANYIEEVTERVVAGRRSGKTQAQLESEVTPATLKTVADRNFGELTAQGLLKHRRMPPPLPTAAQVLSDSVKANVGHIYAALERST